MNGARLLFSFLVLGAVMVLGSCNRTEDLVNFTEEEELLIGDHLADFVESSADFQVLSQEDNTVPYQYAGELLQNIVNAELITKSASYTWKLRILVDETRQAFVLPGGYLYVSTGMIFFLDNEDQFTGLLAHLVSHANFSHTVETLLFKYGINGLKSLAASGDPEQLSAIMSDLDLRGSRLIYSDAQERQADSLSVTLLGRIDQSCEGPALSFDKVLNVQPDRQSGLINAHRLDTARVSAIQEIAAANGCDRTVDETSRSRYTAFRNSLP